MNLQQFFEKIGGQLGLNPDELLAYAQEDALGGYHTNPTFAKWPASSVWEVEGKSLYALVRALKPKHMLEIGVGISGCSTTHILLAMRVNRSGHLTSLDLDPNVGKYIPAMLKDRWTFKLGLAEELIPAHQLWQHTNEPITLVYEDSSHELINTTEVLSAVRDHLSDTTRLLISHDGMHYRVGVNVRGAYKATFGVEPQTALIEPSDCGFAWQVGAQG